MRMLCLWLIGVIYTLTSFPAYTNSETDAYRIKVTPNYEAFSGDLHLTYFTPPGVSLPNAFIMLVSLLPPVTEVTTIDMPSDVRSMSLTVKCGSIEHGGRFAFRMYMYVGGKVLTETSFYVKWPTITAKLPSSHVASTIPISLTITSHAKCNSLFKRFPLSVDMLYYKHDPLTLNAKSRTKPISVSNSSLLEVSNRKIVQKYSCSLFDQAGYYQAVIKSPFNKSTSITSSNMMRVTWSTRYNITSYVSSIFPCQRSIVILFTQPTCDDTSDKIRIYAVHKTVSGSKAAPQNYVYVTERPAYTGLRYMNLNCTLFSPGALGYCFYYVSVSHDGGIKEQTRLCLPNSPDSVLSEDGGWSDWSGWSSCSRTCGTGQQNRKRLCDNPIPYNGGRYCTGDPTQWRPCHNLCDDLVNRLTPLYSAHVDQNCACGCKLTSSKGQIVATGRCHGLSLWPIKVASGRRIRLEFIYYDLDPDYQWVKVRDGKSRDNNLLAFSAGNSVLNDVTSSGNEMLIEFMTLAREQVTSKKQDGEQTHGFIAQFHYINATALPTTVAPIYQTWTEDDTPPAWQSIMTIAGVICCVLIVLVAIAFVVYRQLRKGLKPNYAPSDGEMSPRSVDSPAGTPGDNPEVPLTGELRRKDFSAALSRGPSITSATSGRYILLGRRPGDIGGSPKPSTRHYSPLPRDGTVSPDEIMPRSDVMPRSDIIAPDQIPDPDLWHTPSHSIKPTNRKSSRSRLDYDRGKSPRCDDSRISSRSRKSYRDTKNNLNDSKHSRSKHSAAKTKHEMLTEAIIEHRRDITRDDEMGERVVTGESSTPTSQQQSATSTCNTTEAVVNTQSGRERHSLHDHRDGVKTQTHRKDKPRSGDRKSPHSSERKSSRSGERKSKSPDSDNKTRRDIKPTMDVAKLNDNEKSISESKRERSKHKRRSTQTKNDGENLGESVELSTSRIDKSPAKTATTEFRQSNAKRPTSLQNQTISTGTDTRTHEKPSNKLQNCDTPDKSKAVSVRDSSLPRPDGQSPEIVREDRYHQHRQTPIDSLGNSPAKAPGAELEYDDFIMDDPYSYFDPSQTMKLRWQYLSGLDADGNTKLGDIKPASLNTKQYS